MAKSNTAAIETTETVAALAPLAEVIKGINTANKAAANMYTAAKEAAGLAAAQLDAAKPIGERIAEVMSCYNKQWTNANVKAIFKDALTLHAAAQCPVSVEVIGKDGKKTEAQITAAEAVSLPKHAMRAAAQEVREVHGLGRAKGAGRKPATKAPSDAPAAPDMTPSAEETFQTVLAELDEMLTDAVYLERIKAHLIERGFVLTKAAQGRRVTHA